MVDLSTSYLGLRLKNPLVASSSPLSQKVESALALERAGVSALVMYSLFEEQILRDSYKLDTDLSRGIESFPEALTYLPDYGQYSIGPETYLRNLRNLKDALAIPVIGSLNGVTDGGWVKYAQKIQDAGADALELNLYNVATDPEVTCADLEAEYLRLVSHVRKAISIPLAVKLSPFFTALPNFAKRLAECGVDGIVLFNRFYQPDFDLEALEVVPHLVLSNSNEMRLPLRWIAILYNKIPVDFALTSGIHTAEDLLKALMAGAKVGMATSAFLLHGVERAAQILSDLEAWMIEREYESVTQMIGSMSQQAVADPAMFERANYIRVLSSY
ncbi:MAG: dihydroorotate dehydrogenase-like protein [Anaerolineales bacterium]|nr:dihydroorotate dehydrogenase-like protein [Anaerolineales bacterium]MCS7248785.1 dihydroorotate dehydrogenase-like protein [Anaerolineales bacterium]MDW8162598.1 dihydroorotate dehydrogenase-like protein [Anaerolineales bacterium]MDW8446034.1 dihydroorotate dehydrogenase-like protein [Anaerolineales bacterium]